jgi:hypothetical protein
MHGQVAQSYSRALLSLSSGSVKPVDHRGAEQPIQRGLRGEQIQFA